MSTNLNGQNALGDNAARQLANATKTVPQLSTITPRWLTHLLQWVPVEAGIYRLNRVKDPEAVRATCTAREDEGTLPTTFVPYEENPREYFLNAVSTVLDVHTRISDLYSSPHDQIKEQLRLTIHCSPSTWRTKKVMTIAVMRNTAVATADRREKRASPHTPCPLVQPCASAVP